MGKWNLAQLMGLSRKYGACVSRAISHHCEKERRRDEQFVAAGSGFESQINACLRFVSGEMGWVAPVCLLCSWSLSKHILKTVPRFSLGCFARRQIGIDPKERI